jgi:hypothetical protein
LVGLGLHHRDGQGRVFWIEAAEWFDGLDSLISRETTCHLQTNGPGRASHTPGPENDPTSG